jgi:hypothetical protein
MTHGAGSWARTGALPRLLHRFRLFRALRHRPFALLWSGQSISRLGDGIYRVALAWWVLEHTGSAVAMGSVFVCSFTPMLLFLLVGGVAVDRFRRVDLLLASDLLSGAVVTAVAVLALTARLELWHVYAAAFLFGLVSAFFQPASTAVVPDVTPASRLPSANALTALSGRVMGIAGPAVGAGVIALGGTPLAFALDGASFFLSAACLVPLRGLATAPGTRTASLLGDLREGVGTVLGMPWLRLEIIIVSVLNVTQATPFQVGLPFLLREHLRAPVGALGAVYSASALGATAVALWLGQTTALRGRGAMIAMAWLVDSLVLVLYGLPAVGLPLPLPAVWLGALVSGGAGAMSNLVFLNTLQALVPRAALGRVSSVAFLGGFALLPAGLGLAGWAIERLGAPVVFLLGGGLSVGLALLALLHPSLRAVD